MPLACWRVDFAGFVIHLFLYKSPVSGTSQISNKHGHFGQILAVNSTAIAEYVARNFLRNILNAKVRQYQTELSKPCGGTLTSKEQDIAQNKHTLSFTMRHEWAERYANYFGAFMLFQHTKVIAH